MSKATPDQLRNLPGFGQVKVKNIKNAFEKPVRNKATRTLSIPSSQGYNASNTPIGHSTVAESTSRLQKGKDTSIDVVGQRPREPSPVWDIELDLDGDPATEKHPQPFDIDLDLN
jgi:DNA excision repair protein ERCC-1